MFHKYPFKFGRSYAKATSNIDDLYYILEEVQDMDTKYQAWNRIIELKTVNDEDRLKMLKSFENYSRWQTGSDWGIDPYDYLVYTAQDFSDKELLKQVLEFDYNDSFKAEIVNILKQDESEYI